MEQVVKERKIKKVAQMLMIRKRKHDNLSNQTPGGQGSGDTGFVEAGLANLEFEHGDKLTEHCGLKI